jgi:hypothetical protein
MSNTTYDIAMNMALVIIYGVLTILIIQRVMESRGFSYLVERTSNGMVFTYTLGIYAGCVRITRDWSLEYPNILRKADGWEIVFPGWYTDQQVYRFIMRANPTEGKNKSHSKDLEVFRQVVLKNNYALTCIRGVLFTEDRRDPKRT